MQSTAFRSAHSQWTVILRQHFCLETGDHSWSLGRWEGRTPLPNVVCDILMAGAGEASATDSLVVVSLPPTSQRHGNAFKRDVACERYFRIRVKCISQKISNQNGRKMHLLFFLPSFNKMGGVWKAEEGRRKNGRFCLS